MGEGLLKTLGVFKATVVAFDDVQQGRFAHKTTSCTCVRARNTYKSYVQLL
ncbi:MAG: hypothetical protein ACJAZ9_000901 [Neolewinella sp.]|jgi:hypothetical protein